MDTLPLANIRLIDRPLVGGKAAVLGELMHMGVPVPHGFVVTTAAWEYWHTHRRLSESVIRDIGVQAETLVPPAVAVRSSALAEDGVTAAWAGQFETFLDVSVADVIPRIEACMASASGQRALHYGMHHGVDPRHIPMAVENSSLKCNSSSITGYEEKAKKEAVV